jgi:hypothetical protein
MKCRDTQISLHSCKESGRADLEEALKACRLSVFLTGNLPRGVPEVDDCGLAEIGNSKEETRGTQFRQVRAARCVIPYVLYVA